MMFAENNLCLKLNRDEFFAKYFPRQNWAIPNSIIYYIAKNPKNANIYQKLIQSCKYFFIRNPILIIDSLSLKYENNKWSVDFKNLQKNINLNNILSKFWITDELKILSADSETSADKISSLSPVIPFINKCDAKKLNLQNQNISYNEFLNISSNVENITVNNSVVKSNDGSVVPFEKLVNILPEIKYIQFGDNSTASSITSNTAKNLMQISHFSKIDYFGMSNIPETFNVKTLFTYIKKNQTTKFFLHFSNSISEAYKNQLELINDEILDAKVHEYKIPYLDFDGLDNETRNKLLLCQILNL